MTIEKEEFKSKRKKNYAKEYLKKWIKKFQEINFRHPTHDEVVIWNYGFDAGYKARKQRILNQLGEKNEKE